MTVFHIHILPETDTVLCYCGLPARVLYFSKTEHLFHNPDFVPVIPCFQETDGQHQG